MANLFLLKSNIFNIKDISYYFIFIKYLSLITEKDTLKCEEGFQHENYILKLTKIEVKCLLKY